MDLQEKLVSSFLAFENGVECNHPVHEYTHGGPLKNFEAKDFPNEKKRRPGKYTSP